MGGTFDPIHIGHLLLGESAYEQFGLEKVLFMPSGNPPHKTHRSGATNEQRVAMVEKAIASNPHFELSLAEMHEMGYIYTSVTLTRLKEENPDVDYYFIMGADSLLSFDTWHCPDTICQLCTVVVAVRDNMPLNDLQQAIDTVCQKYHADIRLLRTKNIDISSHEIREWIRDGKSCLYYLPDALNDYIKNERIYEQSAND